MAYIKKKSERKFKITICNGYKVNGQKRMKAQTITVPSTVPKRGIPQAANNSILIESGFNKKLNSICALFKAVHLWPPTHLSPGFRPHPLHMKGERAKNDIFFFKKSIVMLGAYVILNANPYRVWR